MPLSTVPVRASAMAWSGGNLGLKLHLRVPKSTWTSSSEKVNIYVNEKILDSRFSSGGPSPSSRPMPWGSPTRNSIGLRGDADRLDWKAPPKTDLYRYTTGRSSIIASAVKAPLQNSTHLLVSWSILINKRIVPMGHRVNKGLPLERDMIYKIAGTSNISGKPIS